MAGVSQHGSAENASEAWTTRRLIRWIDGHLGSKGIDSPRVCAEMLVGSVIGAERMRLYMEADRPASQEELDRLRALVVRAARHEPVQYLVGEWWFWSKRFVVGPATLIPRPATEHLVEEAVSSCRAIAAAGASPVRMLEIGTGTGCISTCVAAALRGQRRGGEPGGPAPAPVDVRIVATDLVPAALDLARANLAAHRVADAVELRAGDLYAPALAGGPAGMDVLAPLIARAHEWLAPGGTLLCEIGHRQRDDALAAAAANPALAGAEVRKDFEGFWRLLVARRAG